MDLEPTSDANDDDLNDELDDPDEGQRGAVRFDQLTATDFEEFCFDLLAEVGFINVDWRKGTPLLRSLAARRLHTLYTCIMFGCGPKPAPRQGHREAA